MFPYFKQFFNFVLLKLFLLMIPLLFTLTKTSLISLLILLTWENLCSITLLPVDWALKWRFKHLLVFSIWIPEIGRFLSQSRLWDGMRVRSLSNISEKIVALSLNCSLKKPYSRPRWIRRPSAAVSHFL